MKTLLTFLTLLIISGYSCLYAQEKDKYISTYVEYPFTWSNATDNGQELNGPVRFAPFFNFGNNLNIDVSEKAGLYLGWGIHNIGFIYDVDANTRKKVRSYYLGIPVGFKIGNMKHNYIYAGYEIEFPFNYKEKTFINEQKSKFSTWFSDRTPIQQSVTVGIHSPYGTGLKFKYYFTNFYKQGYSESDGQGGTVQPYQNFSANIYMISLTFEFLRGTELAF
jgi:hypothetical protein